jgi:hypothetical protein
MPSWGQTAMEAPDRLMERVRALGYAVRRVDDCYKVEGQVLMNKAGLEIWLKINEAHHRRQRATSQFT